jgi:gliding motility-associated-like protein
MKQFLFSVFLFIGYSSSAQLTITVFPTDSVLCWGTNITIQASIIAAPDTGTVTFQWIKNGVPIADSTRAFLVLKNVTYADTGFYRCIGKVDLLTDTSNSSHLRMHLKLNVDTIYRYNELGCPGICKGQFLAHISGGDPPYTYDWGDGHAQDTLVFGLCPGPQTLIVRDHDGTHCISQYYFVDVLKLPKIKITKNPKDTVYLTHPTLTLSFPDSSKKYLTNWQWDYGDSAKFSNLNPVSHDYSKTQTFGIKLHYTDQNGCDTTITDSIVVKLVNLLIPNVFTPNGDGYNDKFKMIDKDNKTQLDFDLLEVYQSDVLVIFDRWGKKVFEKNDYRGGEWDGGRLPDGVYYYYFKGHGPYSDEIYKGSVTILRGH